MARNRRDGSRNGVSSLHCSCGLSVTDGSGPARNRGLLNRQVAWAVGPVVGDPVGLRESCELRQSSPSRHRQHKAPRSLDQASTVTAQWDNLFIEATSSEPGSPSSRPWNSQRHNNPASYSLPVTTLLSSPIWQKARPGPIRKVAPHGSPGTAWETTSSALTARRHGAATPSTEVLFLHDESTQTPDWELKSESPRRPRSVSGAGFSLGSAGNNRKQRLGDRKLEDTLAAARASWTLEQQGKNNRRRGSVTILEKPKDSTKKETSQVSSPSRRHGQKTSATCCPSEFSDDAWLEDALETAQACHGVQPPTAPPASKAPLSPSGAGSSQPGTLAATVEFQAAAPQTQVAQEAPAQKLACQYHMPIQDVLEVQEQFRVLDRTGCGEIGKEEFRQLIESRMKTKVQLEAPQTAQLREVFEWLSFHAFDQTMLLPPRQTQIRRLAQNWDESFPDVEDIFKAFDSFDNDGSGEIRQHDFGELLRLLLKIPKKMEFPPSRIDNFWKEVDRDRDGKISGEEFFLWFRREFGIGPDPHGPWSKYYHKPFVPSR